MGKVYSTIELWNNLFENINAYTFGEEFDEELFSEAMKGAFQVYDAFYSNGEEDQETFEFMITNGVAMNFRYFLDKSCFNQGIKKKGVA